MTVCALVYYIERMQRTIWFIQINLDELLTLERTMRINAVKMVNFLSHEGILYFVMSI